MAHWSNMSLDVPNGKGCTLNQVAPCKSGGTSLEGQMIFQASVKSSCRKRNPIPVRPFTKPMHPEVCLDKVVSLGRSPSIHTMRKRRSWRPLAFFGVQKILLNPLACKTVIKCSGSVEPCNWTEVAWGAATTLPRLRSERPQVDRIN